MRIAIVGTGIAGLLTGYLLGEDHEVHTFESNSYIGGHTHSIRTSLNGKDYTVDTGFAVFNHVHFPSFVRVLDRIGIKSQTTVKGLGIRDERARVEFSTVSTGGWFAQPTRMFRPSAYLMQAGLKRFRRAAEAFLSNRDVSTTMREFVDGGRFGHDFLEGLLPALMETAWLGDQADPWHMPAKAYLSFFQNHGLLEIGGAIDWRVIRGGSFRYISKLVAPLSAGLHLNTPVESIRRCNDRVVVTPRGQKPQDFDHVVVATAADTALALLADPSRAEQELLGSFPYQPHDVVLHTDPTLLPKNLKARAGWNCLIPSDKKACPVMTQDIRLLQGLEAPEPFLLTFNGTARIAPEKILCRQTYRLPMFSWKALSVQRRCGEINGVNRTHYCGAYWGNGLHEDAITSALKVAQFFRKQL